jgi:hypothetical protein
MQNSDIQLLKEFVNRGFPKRSDSLFVDNHGFLSRKAVKTAVKNVFNQSEIVLIRTGDILPVFFLSDAANLKEYNSIILKELQNNMFAYIVAKPDFLIKYFQSF